MKLRSRLLVVAGLTAGVAGLAVVLAPTAPRIVADDAPKAGASAGTPTASTGDHWMFGDGPDRNFINMNPVSLSPEFPKKADDETAHEPGSRVKWKAALGSRAYGGPIIAGGRVYCGTNNENPRNSRDRGKPTDDNPAGTPVDKSVLMCFDEKSGNFLWQMVLDKLEGGSVND